MPLTNNDLLIVERGGVRYQMTANEIADFVGAIRDFTAADITARDALTGVTVGDRVFVSDASADAAVDAGWAVYRVQSTGPIVYEKIQEQESLDIVVQAAADLGYTASPTSGEVTNTAGNNATIPAVDGTNAGLATPAMLANSHAAATTGGTAASNPVVITGQAITFSIAQLTALP